MSTCLPCQKLCSIHPYLPQPVFLLLSRTPYVKSPEMLATCNFLSPIYSVIPGMGPGNSICILTRTQVFLCSREIWRSLIDIVFHHPYPQVLPTRFQVYSNLPILTKKKLPYSKNKFLFALSFPSPSQKSENYHLYLLPFSFFPVTTHSGLTTLFSVTFCYCSGHSWDIVWAWLPGALDRDEPPFFLGNCI